MRLTPPAVVVLCSTPQERPAHLEPLTGRVELRFTDAAGLADALPGARALLLWDFFSDALQGVWDRRGGLEWIHVAAAGVDRLLFEELRASDVVVTNARGVFDRPIAEFVLASVLAHAKLLHESHDLQADGVWQHREPRAVEGARALVIGTGGIGRATGRLLSAVGLRVSGAGRTERPDDPDLGQVYDSGRLAEYVEEFDYVVNAAPLTSATRGLVDASVLAAMRPSAYLVNVGRGATVVEDDLVDALRRGEIAGAALDVFEAEPLPTDSPLWSMPGVAVSAHMSGDVVGWRDMLARQFVDQALRWVEGRSLENIVDKRLGYVPGQVVS
ncbi:D-2-hydroxyacid dehydrogenase [Luteipulveratus sp. YIM 133132]|uniref:D-2-hydroxyacid dehydrogenase n=1 Tax=Luteipulveratus flavus TaxID=3031728 RepID=UPI0023AF8237|nr:D-2-hydroxyacid dehydrogenase [Luteipulveratus sp. YIM 133132]MDE9367808.1 D-2-hydroxyacid dehydrogenase [Luteipulveratus sp. YIM 133132]